MADEAQSRQSVKLVDVLRANGIRSLVEKVPEHFKTNGLAALVDQSAASVGPGDLCKVKILYEGPPKCKCCINWVESEPEDLKESIEEQAESKRHALLIRMKKNHGEGKPLVLDSIVVQNAHLKDILGQVFSEYSGITTTLKKLVFRRPFREFFYEWKKFNELCESQVEPEKRSIGRLLQNVLASELEETLSLSEDLAQNRVITYDYLWTIFRHGVEVFSSESGHDCIYKLEKASYGTICEQPCFELEVRRVDCNGQEFGWRIYKLAIWKFSGTKPLSELEAIPISLLPNPQELRASAEARGRAARNYQTVSYHYAAYHGTARHKDKNRINISGRIVIDATAYEMFNPDHKLSLKALDSPPPQATIDISDKYCEEHRLPISQMSSCSLGRYSSRAEASAQQEPQLVNRDQKRKPKLPSLDDEFLRFCSPEVRGYCLQTKNWATFDVDLVEPVRWNDMAFENLVIGEDHKRLVLAFVESQVANKDSFDDLIEGKGRGLIMLLEGTPGVGKTLTAEAVADRVKRPLYALSGGELGQDARQLEGRLRMILDVATRWDAVLLLDECDVFLEKRSANNLHRNSIVAVLLRLLEYYRGILFMTTNRVHSIDPAFQSRIHLTIDYPKLDQQARHKIWTYFLRTHCPDAQVLDEEIQELAEADMNGREVKNLVKTAQLLARHENGNLTIEHFRTVIRVFKRRIGSGDPDQVVVADEEDRSEEIREDIFGSSDVIRPIEPLRYPPHY